MKITFEITTLLPFAVLYSDNGATVVKMMLWESRKSHDVVEADQIGRPTKRNVSLCILIDFCAECKSLQSSNCPELVQTAS